MPRTVTTASPRAYTLRDLPAIRASKMDYTGKPNPESRKVRSESWRHEAADEGYTHSSGKSTPFWGYYFRILTAQGPTSEGGGKSYLVDGEMRNGFALVAYPAEYGKGGVMTFLVDQSGIVYEKDLGEQTEELVGEMKAYSPDSTWKPANSQDQ